jgi:hypothetical protein
MLGLGSNLRGRLVAQAAVGSFDIVRLQKVRTSLRGLRGELSERLAAYQAASWALGVVPGG